MWKGRLPGGRRNQRETVGWGRVLKHHSSECMGCLGRWVAKVAQKTGGRTCSEAKERRRRLCFCHRRPVLLFTSPQGASLLPLGAPHLWGRPPLTCPVPTGSGQQGEETLRCRLLGDREVPAGACDLCGRLPSQQPLGTGQDCFWGQGTGQDGGGMCEYGPLPRPTSLGISAPG